MTGAEDGYAGDPTMILFTVEEARKMSPDESFPLPPTRPTPTVARFASRYPR